MSSCLGFSTDALVLRTAVVHREGMNKMVNKLDLGG